MQDFELEAYAQGKLSAYEREAEAVRQLPRRLWRSRAAHLLRGLADGLEPNLHRPSRDSLTHDFRGMC